MIKEGDDVIYQGKITSVEEIKGNKARISNPEWVDDIDDEFMPYWIWVKLKDLKEK